MIEGAKEVFVASGKKTLQYTPSGENKEELLKKVTGRTGNLRAPTLRCGDIFYVGYNVEMYSGLG